MTRGLVHGNDIIMVVELIDVNWLLFMKYNNNNLDSSKSSCEIRIAINFPAILCIKLW